MAQYLKPSERLRARFVEEVGLALDALHNETREKVFKKNSAKFSSVSFRLYNQRLPKAVPIKELAVAPIFNFKPPSDKLPDYAQTIPWQKWVSQTYNFVTDLYKADSTAARGTSLFGNGDHAIIIQGDPGAGKTTELKRLLLDLQDRGMTCILIPLSIYNIFDVQDLFDAAKKYYVREMGLTSEMDFEAFLHLEAKEKRLLLMLDSLDEANLPLRNKILNHVDLMGESLPRIPVYLTSRYVPPQLEQRMPGALFFHLGGLPPKQVVQHVKLLEKWLREGEEQSKSQLPPSILPHLNSAAEALENLIDYLEPASVGVPTIAHDYFRADAANAERIFTTLGQPIFLNLHVGLCAEDSVTEWSLDSIVARYIQFLLDKWIHSRSENPVPDLRELGRANLKRALAYLGFDLTRREHMEKSNPSPEEVEEMLLRYFKSTDQSSRSDAEWTAILREEMDAAKTAQIFDPDTPRQVRFRSPTDLFRDYHVAQFVRLSTRAEETVGSRVKPPRQPFPPSTRATYGQFLENPNLRFLERGMVLYYQTLFENEDNQTISNLFYHARGVDPIDSSHCGCSSEQLTQILPLNLMFLGRVFAPSHLDYYFKELRTDIFRELNTIFLRTNFSTVFEAISYIRHSYSMARSNNVEFHDWDKPWEECDFDVGDKKWRSAENSRKLLKCAEWVLRGTSGGNWNNFQPGQKALLRRIVYQLRYHAESFDEEALRFLEKFYQLGSPVAETAMQTFRRLRTSLSGTSRKASLQIGSKYFDEAEANLASRIKRVNENLTKVWSRRRGDQLRTDGFVRDVITDNELFPFEILRSGDEYLRNFVRDASFDLSMAVGAAYELLSPVEETKSHSNEEAERLAKSFFILRQIAETFEGQQLLLPKDYDLSDIWEYEIPPVKYSPEDILRRLFLEPQRHLQEVGGDRSYVGGLQLYDFSVDTIWAILRKGFY